MEDAATAEIARVQLWQWVRHGARLNTGESITVAYIDALVDQIAPGIKALAPGVTEPDLKVAAGYLKGQVRREFPSEFLTSDLMPYLAVRDGVDAKWIKASL
jgi:malate synthase